MNYSPSNRYFDNAATSYPKPPSVGREMVRYLDDIGGPYGRSAYPRAFDVSRTIEETRNHLAELLGIHEPASVIFTPNATVAINMVLFGLLSEGAHVLVSPLEHNAVMRPLDALAKSRDVHYEVLPHFEDGLVDVPKIGACIRDTTQLVIINQQSNVTGLIQPVDEIKERIGNLPILIDAAQSLGRTAIQIDLWNIDYLAFTGHKGLLGPTGTGGLFLRDPESIRPLVYGGTGSRSVSFQLPAAMPDRFEAGTLNIAGIYGLLGALKNPPDKRHTMDDFYWLCSRIRQIPNIQFFGAQNISRQGCLFSFNRRDLACSDIGAQLSDRFGIETRVGLHCAPLAHQTIGTYPDGTVRIAPSVYHTRADFEYLLNALLEITDS
ncbi:MAG: aminotransferase class V-fold PLP-dependent enzyme [Pirellulales bacterium]|nr:aminotransferase class V-fold PLP-dependent enzyme [Pirellulales bacterium]